MKKFTILLVLGFLFFSQEASAQLFKTSLKVYVNDDLGNVVPGATVKIFETKEDWKAEENQIGETMVTDEDGMAYFEQVDPMVYFILVEKGDMNNWNGAVQTDKMIEKKKNKIRIIIE